LLDERSPAEKAKDYRLEEIVASVNPVTWVEKPREQWRKFPIFNQNGSGSCVAQTLAKLMGILYFLLNGDYVHFSATHIYQRRNNKPQSGMGGTDAFDIAREGVTLEVLVPSQNMTDEQMDKVIVEDYKDQVGKIFKIPKYVMLPVKNLETAASVIQTTGKGVMTWFCFIIKEWTELPKIIDESLKETDERALRHSIAAVDFTLLGKSNMPKNKEVWGKKAVIVDDSWGTSYGVAGQRIITEDFYAKRNFFAAYPLNFVFKEAADPNKPHYTFTKELRFSTTFFTDKDVFALQNILKYEGVFPVNVDSTGYYGAITAKGVGEYKKKYALPGSAEVVDAPMIAHLNKNYSN